MYIFYIDFEKNLRYINYWLTLCFRKTAYAYQWIYLNKNTIKAETVNKSMYFFTINNLLNVFIPLMAKFNFQQPSLQPSVSHDHSEIFLIWWIYSQEKKNIIIHVKNSCAACYFFKLCNISLGFFDNSKFKRTAFHWNGKNIYVSL